MASKAAYDVEATFWQMPQSWKTPLLWTSTLLIAIAVAVILRLRYVVPSTRPSTRRHSQAHPRTKPAHLLVVLGSGGHTAEMFSMLRRSALDPTKYAYRTYIVSSGDGFSAGKAVEFEETFMRGRRGEKNGQLNTYSSDGAAGAASTKETKNYTIITIPRARRVHQSLLTTPFTALQCLFACFNILLGRHAPAQPKSPSSSTTPSQPDLILTNGPGTAACVILASLILQFLNLTEPAATRSIFIESFARVKTLSLSGKLLLPVVDRFLVQWEGLVDSQTDSQAVADAEKNAHSIGVSGWMDQIKLGIARIMGKGKKEYVGVLID